VEETVCRLRGTHVGRKLSERVCDSGFARLDVTRILELTNDPRSGTEQCSCLVAERDDQRRETRQPDRKGSEDSVELLSGRFGCHQTCESVLLNTLRYRHHYRLLVVDALGPCDGACYCLDEPCSTLPQSTFVCPSVADASPCSSTVLPCGWSSVDVDAAVTVQRAAAMSGVVSV
jgi:hypothetical protein